MKSIPQFATTRRRTGRRESRRWFFWRRTPWRRQPSPREEWFGWVQTLLVSICCVCACIKVKHIYLIQEKKPTITSLLVSPPKSKNLERGKKPLDVRGKNASKKRISKKQQKKEEISRAKQSTEMTSYERRRGSLLRQDFFFRASNTTKKSRFLILF